ncbi:hypothetical protein tinsulaeT_20640 [Thalassotalea insulae]|uniref:Gluconate 2-dehydrogenase subunit 3 family protein n=1 Tax=Thalassotalea insulae TaxID=2056778 RepID=A0ABQ6GTQ8_9GAMM|nr:gluconate 2-dehydrogenase subunit 3 family protein [Thalassotalea insulae]GLX78724.1 hypothetical protein tinsulaeT_20640 [Thalassotalea insulae]
MDNFFDPDKAFKTPNWLAQKISRRQMLKSAAGATAIAGASRFAVAMPTETKAQYQQALQQPQWQTLDAVLNHLLPRSASGPGAKEIHATFYLYQLVHQQPTAQDEIEFIFQGVKWLNDYSQSQLTKIFTELTSVEKEQVLKGISRSQAGSNWLNMLILNIYEAMLSPPAYGGNPQGIGWQWLEHQAGFPLPKAGQRYYELPPRSRVSTTQNQVIHKVSLTNPQSSSLIGKTKA